ncbi:MAG: spore germination protein, GerA family [Firmicutes bacterium]|nr:spore germination protein, GerA family [Bacillota bacterium]
MFNFIFRIYRYLRYIVFAPETNPSPVSPDKYTNNTSSDFKQAKLALDTLILLAARLQALILLVQELLQKGLLKCEINLIKSEIETLEHQLSRLSPLVISYEQNSTGKIDYDLISADLSKNLEFLRDSLKSSDIVIREFNLGCDKQTGCVLLYVDGLTDRNAINNTVLKPLMYDSCLLTKENLIQPNRMDSLQKNLLLASDVTRTSQFSDLLDNLMRGGTILLINGAPEALVISTTKWESRGVEKPELENVVRGPREGFSESLRINTSLLRRKISNPNLRFEEVKIGKQTKTNICIAYLANVADPKLIIEIKKRLSRIHTDAILDSGYIEAFIEDAPYSIFATVANSEKPDVVAAKLLEGRAALLVDGSPIVLTMPMLFIESFQSPEDYYVRPYYASTLRLIRFQAYLSSIFSPGVYVALISFHQVLIPTQLLITLAAGQEKVPFSAALEAFMMGIVFEILREAGVRLPRPVGSAVSIVGALVLGQTAVSAGLIGPIMVIVVAITAITSFVIPSQADSGIILRFIFLFSAGLAGGFGILMALIVILLHLTSLRSFGVPFFSPVAPFSLLGLKDVFARFPLWIMSIRPQVLEQYNSVRQNSGLRPSKPK